MIIKAIISFLIVVGLMLSGYLTIRSYKKDMDKWLGGE